MAIYLTKSDILTTDTGDLVFGEIRWGFFRESAQVLRAHVPIPLLPTFGLEESSSWVKFVLAKQ